MIPEQMREWSENCRLRNLLSKYGICPECGEEVYHWEDEPFSSCKCFDGAEDTTGPSVIQKLRKQIHNLNIENEELNNWKREQLWVWNGVDSYVRGHPEIKIGESVAAKTLKFLIERDELIENKKEIEESFKFIMDERGSNNEVHCTCVPFLKIRIKELEKEIDNIKSLL